jgi:acetate kinase
MKILVLNAGSSSLKFTLFSMAKEQVLAKGLVERLGSGKPNMIFKRPDGFSEEREIKVANHVEALKAICDKLIDPKIGVLKSMKEVEAFGHRVVHGGERATRPGLVSESVKEIIRDCFALAPLHNPANLAGIEACELNFPGVPNVAVFDTAFHQSMPPQAFLYALPYELYTKYGIRRYGFHGTSHNFVAKAAGAFLGTHYKKLKLITCHLGNGCSMAAINQGVVIDTSMGMTPLEGLVMGTRCGDMDPAVVLRLIELGKKPQEIEHVLNKESGLLGVGGIGSGDMRDIIAAEKSGDQQALRARRMFTRRVIKYIGGYYALLDGADAIVFTGGIGEWSAFSRARIVSKLSCFGIELDVDANETALGKAAAISTANSKCKVLVIPTDEELMIARSTRDTIGGIPEEK